MKGEALYAQGREGEARREHEIAEREIGRAPRERMPKLWLARIHARRGELPAADSLYESLWPAAPAVDVEAAVNHAEAHIINKDWPGARLLLERLLARDSKNVRAREVLAWVLEVTGDLEHELPVRADLASDQPTSVNWSDQGRALERAGEFRAAYASYQNARAAANGQESLTLTTSLNRMRYRLSPEVAGGFLYRRDPHVDSLRSQAGLALPLGSRHSLSLVGWHEGAWGHVSRAGSSVTGGGAVTGIGASALLAGRGGETLILGGDLRTTSTNRAGAIQDLGARTSATRVGGSAEGALPFLGHAEVHVRGDLNEPWNDAAVTISEGGRLDGISGQLFLFSTSRRLLLNCGAQERWLRLNPEQITDDPTSRQRLLFGGVDLVLWSRPGRLLRGEVLDEKLARRSYLSDAAILSYRHQHLWGRSSMAFSQRLVLTDEAATHIGSAIVRKVVLNGLVGIDTHGALGYDTKNAVTLYTGGAAIAVTPSWSTRFSVSYDVTKETASGFGGTRHAGWISFHADI